ncbi:MAG: RsbRD N-terminal domain-containing protein [Desulfobulbus sp.]|jgi:hypothetical protein
MDLNAALTQKQEEIVALWIERTLDSYAAPGFFKQSKDPFANPVGSTISSGLRQLFELVRTGAENDMFVRPLDQVIRIRAVQEFTAAQAVAPFLELKWIVRQVFSGDKATLPLASAMDELDLVIERMALLAFDIYSQCREQLYRNRIRELKSGNYILTDGGCPSARFRQTAEETASRKQ